MLKAAFSHTRLIIKTIYIYTKTNSILTLLVVKKNSKKKKCLKPEKTQ